MNIKQWILSNIKDFNTNIKSEEDLKIKVLIPFLKELGFSDSDFRFEHSIDVAIGTKKTTVFSDLEILIDGRVEIVIDTKSPAKSISEKDVLQSASYAKLINTPPALYGITTNGLECVVTNVYTGKRTTEIPSRQQLLRDIDKSKKSHCRTLRFEKLKVSFLHCTTPKNYIRLFKTAKMLLKNADSYEAINLFVK